MEMRKPEKRMFLKSFGYGMYLARLVPPEPRAHWSNEARAALLSDLARRVHASDIPGVLEVLPDPGDPEVAFVLCGEGLPACQQERDQTEPEELERAAEAAQRAGSERFADRLHMLAAPSV